MKIAKIKNNDLMLSGEVFEYPEELSGGRNLVKESDSFLLGVSSNGITKNITSEGYLRVVTTEGNSDWHTEWMKSTKGIEDSFVEGELFTISFTIRRISGDETPRIFIKENMGYFDMSGIIGDDFQTIAYSGVWRKAKDIEPHLGWAGSAGVFEIKNWKIEKGNKVTPWTPAPEDIGLEYPEWIQHFNPKITPSGLVVKEIVEGNGVGFGEGNLYAGESIEGVDL